MIDNPWDINARRRHQQIVSGKDISLTKILCPELIALVEHVSPNHYSIVLEVGCGTGYFTKLLGQVSGDLVAIDPSTQAINIAKEYLSEEQNISIECIPIEDFEPNSGTLFDLVVSNMTFHVIPDLSITIKKISTIIRNHGSLIFSIPHPCFWPVYKGLDSSQSFFYHQTSSHSIPFTISNDENPLSTKIPYHHRSIEYYSKLLSSSGFLISTILEPFPDETLMKLYDKSWDYPHFLIISATMFKNP